MADNNIGCNKNDECSGRVKNLGFNTNHGQLSAKSDQTPVYMFIRIGISMIRRCRNALWKHFAVHGNYNGHVVGIGEHVQVLEGYWPRDKAVAVLLFDTMRDAQHWYDSVPEIRQPDWLDGVDIFAVPLRNNEPIGQRWMELMNIEFDNYERFSTEYVSQMHDFFVKRGASVAVVGTDRVRTMRGLWDPHYIVINQFDSEEDFSDAYCSTDYQPLKQLRTQTSTSNVVLFKLEALRTYPIDC